MRIPLHWFLTYDVKRGTVSGGSNGNTVGSARVED